MPNYAKLCLPHLHSSCLGPVVESSNDFEDYCNNTPCQFRDTITLVGHPSWEIRRIVDRRRHACGMKGHIARAGPCLNAHLASIVTLNMVQCDIEQVSTNRISKHLFPANIPIPSPSPPARLACSLTVPSREQLSNVGSQRWQ